MSIKYLLNIFNNENDISLNTILRYGVNELTSNNMDKKYLNQGYDILEITFLKCLIMHLILILAINNIRIR